MGINLVDQYSLLHFAVGVICYFWGISLTNTFILHVIFELSENTQIGMRIINTLFKNVWPGGKPYADSGINSVGDTLATVFGWLVARYVDVLGARLKWYEPHL